MTLMVSEEIKGKIDVITKLLDKMKLDWTVDAYPEVTSGTKMGGYSSMKVRCRINIVAYSNILRVEDTEGGIRT